MVPRWSDAGEVDLRRGDDGEVDPRRVDDGEADPRRPWTTARRGCVGELQALPASRACPRRPGPAARAPYLPVACARASGGGGGPRPPVWAAGWPVSARRRPELGARSPEAEGEVTVVAAAMVWCWWLWKTKTEDGGGREEMGSLLEERRFRSPSYLL